MLMKCGHASKIGFLSPGQKLRAGASEYPKGKPTDQGKVTGDPKPVDAEPESANTGIVTTNLFLV